jgi:hypothetical protein
MFSTYLYEENGLVVKKSVKKQGVRAKKLQKAENLARKGPP